MTLAQIPWFRRSAAYLVSIVLTCVPCLSQDSSIPNPQPLNTPAPITPNPLPSGSASNAAIPSTAPAIPSTGPSIQSPPPATPALQNPPPASPSLDNRQPSRPTVLAPKLVPDVKLPTNAGQYWVEYDIRAYTDTVKNMERPQQVLIDWILRETGTDSWFGEVTGVITADKSTLRVYHTQSMHTRIAQLYERFVNGVAEPQVFGLRMIQIANPQWRARSLGLMKSIPSNSTGVQAWLMPKENGAILLAQLRERSDAKEIQALEIPLYNGQLQALEQLRSRNYLKEYTRNTAAPYPPMIPVSDEIKEGFRLQISPLLSLDARQADLMIKCEIDQVERLNQVRIDLPMGGTQTQSAYIEVPQIVSWRLQEKIQWPTDQVLLLSCGIVAAPNAQPDNTLLANPPSILGLNRVIPAVGQRTDALLWLEYRGPLSTQIHHSSTAQSPAQPAPMTSSTGNLSRGRY